MDLDMAEKQKKPPAVPDEMAEHHSAATEADVLKYWTEENQEAACPVPFPAPQKSQPVWPTDKQAPPKETK